CAGPLVNTIFVPSGDHVGVAWKRSSWGSTELSVRWVWPAPSASITQMSNMLVVWFRHMYAMRVPSGDQVGPRSSSPLLVRQVTSNVSRVTSQISALGELPAGSVVGCLVNTIFCPSGDQSASSSINSRVFVMFIGSSITLPSRSGTLMMKMSLSAVAAPGSGLIGSPVPDAERWNAMYLPFGDQVAGLPGTRR